MVFLSFKITYHLPNEKDKQFKIIKSTINSILHFFLCSYWVYLLHKIIFRQQMVQKFHLQLHFLV